MGDERGKSEVDFHYQYKEKEVDVQSQSSIKKSTAINRMVIVGCLVCVATTIIVAGIAVPLSQNSVTCDTCDDVTCPPQGPTTTKQTTPDTPSPPLTTTTAQGPGTTTPTPVKRSNEAVTSLGTYVGHEVDMDTGNEMENCMSWLGIRFAKEPGRWERPEAAEPLEGGRYVADHHRTMCPQGGGIFFLSGQQDAWDNNFGEDCLFLNIFAPVDKSRGPYPVMIYFYGGAYQSGGKLQYSGQTLVNKGVVVVTMNYRLSIFGFATTTDGHLKGNYGLWDQLESMKFVKKYIEAFGGDPNQITIFGQSAGAGSIGAHLVSPHAKDYFDKTLLQSGNELSFWAFNSDLQEPGELLPQVAENAKCDTTKDTEEWVNCLRQLDHEELRAVNHFECKGFCLGMVPTIDGDFVPEHPFDMMDRGDFNDKPMMIGANTGECHLYVFGMFPWTIPEAAGWNRTAWQYEMAEVVSWFEYLIDQPDYSIDEAYNFLNFYYTPWGNLNDKTLGKEVIGQMCTDGAWTAPTAQGLKMRARHGKSKLYQYTNGVSTNPILPPLPGWIRRGVPHQFEIPHIWGWPTIYFSDSEELKKDTFNLHCPFCCWSDEDAKFTEFIQTLWTNFAKYGDPTPEPIQHPFMDEPVSWLPYDNEDYHYFYMDNEIAGSYKGFRLREAALFNEYFMKNARGHFANPDEVQFVPYQQAVNPNGMGPHTKEETAHNEIIKRTKRKSLEHSQMRMSEYMREMMIGDTVREKVTANDGPIMTIIREILIPRINETLLENRDITINELIDLIIETIRDTRCVQTTGYFYREVIEDNRDEILAFLRQFLEDRVGDATLPPGLLPTIPTLPTLPTLPPGLPTLPPFPGRR